MKSLLSISIESTIYQIFIILGVVIAASLIVYFIWELVTNLMNKKQGNQNVSSNKANAQNGGLEDFNLDGDTKQVQEEPKLLEEPANEVEETESDEERLNRERREYLEKRRQELIRRIQEENAKQEAEENVEEENAEEETSEEINNEEVDEDIETDEEVDEVEDEEVEQEENEETDEVTEPQKEETVESLEEERQELVREKEKYEQMVQELEEAKKKLFETAPTIQTVVVTPLDELKERLAYLEEKLKANEKDFKQCKKDFIPLNKVWRTHENDEKKLRRKEALVAKQKVVLYGVNNYADIDEEKAKKLAEDLDLLDGLKLSVQHCEEVMEKNAERYPLLKRMYEVLKRQNTELKDEIKSIKEEIETREGNGEEE